MSGRFRPWLALAAVTGLHALLALHFAPPDVIFGPRPVAGLDYDLHVQQTYRAVDAWKASGRAWGYDPHLLAGMPAGAIDGHNKLIELLAIAGHELGAPVHRSFNLVVLVTFLLVPLAVYASARLFDLERGAAVLAAGLASCVWTFDSLAHWVFYVGMIAWAGVAYLWLLPLALFHRWLKHRSPWALLGVLALLALLHMHHAYAFFALVVPMAVLYGLRVRELRVAEHVAVAAVAVGTLVANLWWLGPARRVWHDVLDTSYYMGATPTYLACDYFGFLQEPGVQGVIAQRTSFRFLVLAAAVLGLIAWRRGRDARFWPFAAGLGAMLVAAYGGLWLPGFGQIQPYRLLLPAVYLAILPAAAWLFAAALRLPELRPRPLVIGLGALVAVVALPRFGRDVAYFLPDLLVPRPDKPLPAPPPEFTGGPAFGSILWPRPHEFRIGTLDGPQEAIIEHVRSIDPAGGRWLVEWWNLGERLAWATDAQILGGFREINLAHSDANLFREFPDGEPDDPAELERYFERYNVRWLVLMNPMPRLEGRTDVLVFTGYFFGQRVYRTRIAGSWFLDGGPGRVDASFDRIVVSGSRGGDLVLKYHYLEGLRCRPGCRVRRVPVEGDRVGFIGVENAPRDFEVTFEP